MIRLKDEKNMPENQTYYMPICMCLGVSFGVAIGSVIDARKRTEQKDSAENAHEETA